MKNNTHQFNFVSTTVEELTREQQELVNAAMEITPHAYAPYSNFKVGAAVGLTDGSIITGTNIENASYPAGICAERAALSAIRPFPQGQKIKAIAVYYISSGAQCTPIAPCGICRQVILEYRSAQDEAIQMLLASPSGEVAIVDDINHLLPLFFSKQSLK